MSRKRTPEQTVTPAPLTPTFTAYLDSDEAAQILHVGPVQVARYIRNGGLRASRVGRKWLIAADDLHQFIHRKPFKAATA
jgi:excisionase family DNA binding protein